MNKSQLVEGTATQLRCSRLQAGQLVEAVLAQINEGLKRDGKVTLVGFGTFRRVERKARTGRNPHTGEELTIPAGHRVRFNASGVSPLREAIARV